METDAITPKSRKLSDLPLFTDRVLRERYREDDSGLQTEHEPLYRDDDCDCFDKNIFEEEEGAESENINNTVQDIMVSGRVTESSPEVADLMRQPFKVFGVTFAPLSIPLQRRLQVGLHPS